MDTIKSILHMDHVAMQFGGVVTVNGLSLDINEREIVALIGLNGTGEAATFDCVIGIYRSTYGSVSSNSQVILADTPQDKMRRLYTGDMEPTALTLVHKAPDQITRSGVARAFQNTRLSDNLTVFESIPIVKHIRAKQGVLSAVLRLNHAEEKRMGDEFFSLLEVQGLVYLKDKTVSSLPYDLQRRLEIVKALTASPSLLLLDEPAAGMNPQRAQDLTDFIRQIRDSYHLTIFMIEHRMDLVIQVSDRIYVLDFGKLTTQGTSDEVRNNSKIIETYLGVSDDVDD